VRLSYPTRGEPFESDPKAIQLLKELQSEFNFKYISPFRGHSSSGIDELLREEYEQRISSWIDGLGPNTKVMRELKAVAAELNSKSRDVLKPLIENIVNVLPGGMRPETKLDPNIDMRSFVSLLSSSATLSLSTGAHDESYVSPSKVGSGLRSLLELAIRTESNIEKKTLLAIEEPEAFLHPAAQRMLAKELNSQDVHQRLISTHSPIFVEESDLAGVVLVKDHKFYPCQITSEKMQEVNLALLKKHGAELLFAQSVMLVEGESDYFFFEVIRERLMEVDTNGLLNGLYVLPVGGKEIFCPYVNLIDSFGESDHPIDWLIVADGDAYTSLRKTIRGIKGSVSQELEVELQDMANSYNSGNVTEWISATLSLNKILEKQRYKIALLPGDLEYTILENATDGLLNDVKRKINFDQNRTKNDLLKKLGSKGVDGEVVNNPQKGPYVRAFIARKMRGSEFGRTLRTILKRWAAPLGVKPRELDEFLNKI